MCDRYVVDTNVLIAASSADPVHPKDIDATPQDPALRLRVWSWLKVFRESEDRLVLDLQQGILSEYKNKLGFNDFGIQVVMHKWSTCAVDDVNVMYDEGGHGVLPRSLSPVIHDLDDRKMVAACLDAIGLYEVCQIAFAGDTDWHDWEAALAEHGVNLLPIIEDWSRQRHAEKKGR
ncbi:MAG: hypothetical protein ACK6BC_11255 [Cyanobacteriota bacterium]|jgi:hypothetical protein